MLIIDMDIFKEGARILRYLTTVHSLSLSFSSSIHLDPGGLVVILSEQSFFVP